MTRLTGQLAGTVAALAVFVGASATWANIVASNSLASVSLVAQSSPAPGFITYTFSVTPAALREVGTIEAEFTSASMRQVNPGGAATIWTDANGSFAGVGESPLSDSQFEFSSAGLLFVPFTTPAESSTLLTASFTGFAPITTTQAIAHIVLPTAGSGIANLSFVVRLQGSVQGQRATFNNIPFDASAIPEASAAQIGLVLAIGIAVRGSMAWRRRWRTSAA
jgi:hypothetical protein